MSKNSNIRRKRSNKNAFCYLEKYLLRKLFKIGIGTLF